MPAGHVHYKQWKRTVGMSPLLAAIVFAGAYNTGVVNPISVTLGTMVGSFLGRWIDPDLDLIGITNAESRMMRDLKLMGAFLTAWWIPYSYLMRFIGIGKKGHRNVFSHFPGISTAIRVAWLLAFPPISGAIYWLHTVSDLSRFYPYGGAFILGLTIGLTFTDTVHYIADMRS